MKFLNFFDTRIDSEELFETIKAHWEWNVILVKCHRIKLLIPLLFTLLSLLLLALILYIINVNLLDWYETIFWLSAIFYLVTTLSWMWFSVWLIIDTIRNQIWEKNKYIVNPNNLLKRKKLFEIFLKWSTGMMLLHILFVVFNASVPFIFDVTWKWNLAAPLVVLLLNVLFLINVTMIMYRIIDYEMNFGICSPESFKLFKQTWILTSDVTDISPQSINIIKYKRKWLFESLFHYWSVCLYTDAEIRNEQGSVIEFKYIPDPKNIVKKLNQILGKSV